MDPATSYAQLETFLAKIERPGEFCCGGVFTGHLPGIVVKDFGILGLPLVKDKAQALANFCSLMHFGHGEEALQDGGACSSWQLDPLQFKICNPDWHSAVEQLAYSKIKSELGLPNVGSFTVQLNSLFLCEKGGCHLPLLDAEKDNRTFAMLVLLLPSIYSGGEFIITHNENKETFNYSLESVFKNHYLGFYANCRHLLQPVENGNLLALIYNLVLTNPTCPPPLPADTNDIIPNVTNILSQWQMQSKEGALKQKFLVIVLNHACSKSGLLWKNLNGRNRAISSVVKSAIEKLPIDIYLCLIHYDQCFGCDTAEIHDFNQARSLCNSSEDSKNGDMGSSVSGESKMSSAFEDETEMDSECYLSDFIKVNGERAHLKDVRPNQYDVIPSNAFKGKFPYKEVVTATGRAVVTKLRSYRQAALLLLPRKDFNQIITEGSLNEVIHLALECAENLNKKKSDEIQHKSNTAVTAVISRIETLLMANSSVAILDSQDCIKILRALQLIQNDVLFQWFISKVLLPQLNSFSMEVFFHLALATTQFGLDALLPVFQSLIITGQTPTIMNLLKDLCVTNLSSINVPEKLTHLLASNLLERLLEVEDKNVKEARKLRSLQDIYRDTISAITGLFCTFSTFGNEAWLQQAINYVRRTPLRHPVEIVVTAAIECWHRWLMAQTCKSLCNAVTYQFAFKQQIQLAEDCIKQLMLVKEPKKLIDSFRNTVATCKCSDCKTVQTIMNNAGQNVHSMIITQTTFDHLQKCKKIEAFELSVKEMDVKTFLDDTLITLTLTKRNEPDRLRETYNKCQTAIISLTSLLPQNHPLKLQLKELVEGPLKKKLRRA